MTQKVKEITFLTAPVVLLVVLGFMLLGKRGLFQSEPAVLFVESVTLGSITGKLAASETSTPMDQIPVPGTGPVYPKSNNPFKPIDTKATVVLNYRDTKPTWWGRTQAPIGYLKSTASMLAWNVNNGLSYRVKGKTRYYSANRTAGIFMRGNPTYDATLDRYVAMFYFPLKAIPAPSHNVDLRLYFWPNRVSPPAKVTLHLKTSDKGRRSIENLTRTPDFQR